MNRTVHYSIIMALYWSNFAILLNYASVYLLERGFQNTQIGIMLAAAALAAAVAQPLIGSYADRPGSLSVKSLLLAGTGIFLVLAMLIPATAVHARLLLPVVYAAAAMVLQSLTALMNALGTVSDKECGYVNFGVARGVGSLGYAAASALIGRGVARFGNSMIPWLAAGIYAVLAVCVFLFPFAREPAGGRRSGREGFLSRYPGYTVVLAAAILLYTAHSLLNNFMFQVISYKGGDSASMGIAYAIAAVTELPVMFFFSRLLRILPSGKWLLVSGFAFTAKHLGALLAPGVTGFCATQLMQVLAYALLAVASVYYTERVIPAEDAVKGQSCFAMTATAGSVLGSALGGRLLDVLGVPSLLLLSVFFSAAGAAVMAAGLRIQDSQPAKERDGRFRAGA